MTSFEDVPQDLVLAISHANRILFWQENLDEGEMPPQWMFPYDDPLTEWFERISRERKAGYGSSSSDDDYEAPGMIQNELSPGR